MCEAIYICNTQHIFKKSMDGYLSDLPRLLKNGGKSHSFSAHLKHHFTSNTSHTELLKYMIFKVLNELNPIGAMKAFTKTKF